MIKLINDWLIRSCILLMSVVTLIISSGVLANEDTLYSAISATDPNIPINELKLLIKPLTKQELVIEANTWMALLKTKVHQISHTEIAVKYKNTEIEKAKETTETVKQGIEHAAKTVEDTIEVKSELLGDITQLRNARIALTDRANIVLDELDKKSGTKEGQASPTSEHRLYIDAISRLQVDVFDIMTVWATLSGWLISEEGGIRWLKNIGIFLATLFAFWILSRIAGKTLRKAMSVSFNVSQLLREFASKTIQRLVLMIGVLVGLSALEINIGPILAVIGAAGFVIAFALQNTLGNVASGIMILVFRPFDVGDSVEVAGVAGKVVSLNLVSITITTFDNKVLMIPNNSVLSGVITNATANKERRVDMVFSVGYDDDIDKAQAILENIVRNHPLVLANPETVIKVHELGDSSVNFICRPWTKTPNYWTVYWDITRMTKVIFDKQNISIPYPQTDVHLYQNTSKLRQTI